MSELVRLHPDSIAELVEQLAPAVAALLANQTKSDTEPGELKDAAWIAQRFGLTPAWVREHKTELGAVLVGDGPRPRLRFDPAAIDAFFARAASPVPEKSPEPARRRPRRRATTEVELLPVKPRQA